MAGLDLLTGKQRVTFTSTRTSSCAALPAFESSGSSRLNVPASDRRACSDCTLFGCLTPPKSRAGVGQEDLPGGAEVVTHLVLSGSEYCTLMSMPGNRSSGEKSTKYDPPSGATVKVRMKGFQVNPSSGSWNHGAVTVPANVSALGFGRAVMVPLGQSW